MPARTIRQRLETKGARKYATNSELQSELKRVYEELDRSQSSIAEKDKIIASLSKKINTLKDQVSSASDAVRKQKRLVLINISKNACISWPALTRDLISPLVKVHVESQLLS
jgi:chromosome segregation ATPase